ncbi:SAG-related sequence [Besnoitia besnoiti]|uniref:SAG-related sequence n=1 Tax=Besnoitia besnoiti TaxID=94643 RepID=A0A2A9MHA8_BESBE|nr:SAG-related sequence [Besnoitia besnoiti]PFH36554.1 SAG-related sequence [Besnoitia besnoiti]
MTPRCAAADKPLALCFMEKNGKAEFKCPPRMTTLLQASETPKTEFCEDSTCETAASLSDLNLQLDERDDTYAFTAKGPPDKPCTVCFGCTANAANKTTAIRAPPHCVLLPATSRDTCSPHSVYRSYSGVCDGKANQQVLLKVNQNLTPVTFACGGDRVSSSVLPDHVIQPTGNAESTTEVILQSAKSQAALIANGSSISPKANKVPAYPLSVPELPQSASLQLQYKIMREKQVDGKIGKQGREAQGTQCKLLNGREAYASERPSAFARFYGALQFHFDLAAAESPVSECKSAASPLVLDLNEPNKQVKFKCKDLPTLLPPPATRTAETTTHFCLDSACKTTAALSEFNLRFSGDSQVYTLQATALPATPQTVYFNCAPADGAKSSNQGTGDAKRCVVQISVWSQTPSSVLPTNVCAEEKGVSLKVDKDLTPVTFGCGDKRTLTPVLLDQVFQPTETAASSPQPASLTSLVPTAALTANVSDKDAAKWHAYTLTVKELPEVAPVQLLYECIATPTPTDRVREEQVGEQNKQPDCDVLIEVDQRPSTSGGSDSETGGGQRASLVAASAIVLASFPILSFIL